MFKNVLLVIIGICTIKCNCDTCQFSNKNLWKPSDILKSITSSPLCLFELGCNGNLRKLTSETVTVVGKYYPISFKLFTDANRLSSVHKSLSRMERLEWANRIQIEGRKLFRNLMMKLNAVQQKVQKLIRLQNNKLRSRCASRLKTCIDLVLRLPSLIKQFVARISICYSNRATVTTNEDVREPISKRTTTEKTTTIKPGTTKAQMKKTTLGLGPATNKPKSTSKIPSKSSTFASSLTKIITTTIIPTTITATTTTTPTTLITWTDIPDTTDTAETTNTTYKTDTTGATDTSNTTNRTTTLATTKKPLLSHMSKLVILLIKISLKYSGNNTGIEQT